MVEFNSFKRIEQILSSSVWQPRKIERKDIILEGVGNLMKVDKSKDASGKILSLAGIKINGNNSWDIKVHNEGFYPRVLDQGSLGLGESFMDGWWDCDKLDEFFYRVLRSQIESKVRQSWALLFEILLARVFNLQSKKRAFQIGEKHYDLGNELFQNMLDKRMVYSCAYWKDSHTLDEAQVVCDN